MILLSINELIGINRFNFFNQPEIENILPKIMEKINDFFFFLSFVKYVIEKFLA